MVFVRFPCQSARGGGPHGCCRVPNSIWVFNRSWISQQPGGSAVRSRISLRRAREWCRVLYASRGTEPVRGTSRVHCRGRVTARRRLLASPGGLSARRGMRKFVPSMSSRVRQHGFHHPLLDWRTGLDMARLALDVDAQIDLRYPYWSSLVERMAGPYLSGLGLATASLGDLHAGIDHAQHLAVILVHPLWDRSPTNYRQPRRGDGSGRSRAPGACMWSHSTPLRAVRFPYE